MISRASLANSLERAASWRPLRCMMFLNCEWPAMRSLVPLLRVGTRLIGAPRGANLDVSWTDPPHWLQAHAASNAQARICRSQNADFGRERMAGGGVLPPRVTPHDPRCSTCAHCRNNRSMAMRYLLVSAAAVMAITGAAARQAMHKAGQTGQDRSPAAERAAPPSGGAERAPGAGEKAQQPSNRATRSPNPAEARSVSLAETSSQRAAAAQEHAAAKGQVGDPAAARQGSAAVHRQQRQRDKDKQKSPSPAAPARPGQAEVHRPAAPARSGRAEVYRSAAPARAGPAEVDQGPDQKQAGRVQVSEEKRSGVRERLTQGSGASIECQDADQRVDQHRHHVPALGAPAQVPDHDRVVRAGLPWLQLRAARGRDHRASSTSVPTSSST